MGASSYGSEGSSHAVAWLLALALAALLSGTFSVFAADEIKRAPCNDDAVIVFDASGSMSGNQTLGVANSPARIDEVRGALAEVLPSVTQLRRVGLVTYGPGPYNQCNVKLELKPTPHAAALIMGTVNALVPAGKTPLTSGAEVAAEALDFRHKPGVIVVITDGEETCGRSPCELARQLNAAGAELTIHVIGFRYESYTWTGTDSVVDLMCLAEETHGLYIKAKSEGELVRALEKTLNCPMISQPTRFGPGSKARLRCEGFNRMPAYGA